MGKEFLESGIFNVIAAYVYPTHGRFGVRDKVYVPRRDVEILLHSEDILSRRDVKEDRNGLSVVLAHFTAWSAHNIQRKSLGSQDRQERSATQVALDVSAICCLQSRNDRTYLSLYSREHWGNSRETLACKAEVSWL